MSPDFVQLINTGVVPVGLALVMFSIGLTLAPRDFGLVARHPLLVGAGFATHLLVLPTLGFLVGVIFRLPPQYALGLFIISLCPAGTTSNAMTFVGRGNVALAIVLTALSSIVTVFTIPLVLAKAVPWYLEGAGATVPPLSVPGLMMQLALITLLPILVGMVLRHVAPDLAGRLVRWLRPVSLIVVIVVILFSVVVSWEMVLANLVQATPAAWALNLAAMGFGLLLGRLLGVDARDAMTLSIETGVQNVTLALLLTMSVLNNLSLAVTQNIYGVLMIFDALLLIRWWRGRIAAAEAAAQ